MLCLRHYPISRYEHEVSSLYVRVQCAVDVVVNNDIGKQKKHPVIYVVCALYEEKIIL